MVHQPYPKPGPTGGKLIREVIGLLRSQGLTLPVLKGSHILIAVSGGADSVALGHLLTHYGRRVAAKGQIKLLHINHGWRGVESDSDARFVADLARKWGVPLISKKLKQPKASGESWEELARQARKVTYQTLAKREKCLVFTGHQADDLAETLLWRLFTGTADTHGGGIVIQHGVEVRPFLKFRKQLLKQYLLEEGQSWREDSTNAGGRFLRSRMRQNLMPLIEELFPRAIENLVNQAIKAQGQGLETREVSEVRVPELLLGVSGLKARRPHWEWIKTQGQKSRPKNKGEIHLPGGWKLIHHKQGLASAGQKNAKKVERWVLEKSISG